MLNVEGLSEGFDEFVFNCKNVSIAVTSGYYTKINYFIYLFIEV